MIRNSDYILDNIQIKIEKGQKVGIIGSSGSGKSTLLKVVAGILQAQTGNILLNGTMLPNHDGLTHRDLLYLAQDTDIFSATICENITLYKNIPDDDVEKSYL